MEEICESHGKEKGGPWECYKADDFYGCEAERVVAVTSRDNILEMATRARTELILIIANEGRLQEDVKAAADKGLVDFEVIESEKQIENTNESTTEVMQIQYTPIPGRKVLVAKRRIKKLVKENDALEHTDTDIGLIDVEVVTGEIQKLEL